MALVSPTTNLLEQPHPVARILHHAGTYDLRYLVLFWDFGMGPLICTKRCNTIESFESQQPSLFDKCSCNSVSCQSDINLLADVCCQS